MNIETYPKYNGYEGSIISQFLGIIPKYLKIIYVYLRQKKIISLLLIMTFILFLNVFVKLFSKDKGFSTIILFAILITGSRGFDHFHALPYFASVLLFALILFKETKRNSIKIGISIILVGYLVPMHHYLPFLFEVKNMPHETYYDIVKQLTSVDEPVYFFNVSTTDYVVIDCKPASEFASFVPWFADVYENELIQDLQNTLPQVIVYDPEYAVGPDKFIDFAPKMYKYITENYSYSKSLFVWIRNGINVE